MDNINKEIPVFNYVDANDALTLLLTQHKKGKIRSATLKRILMEWGQYGFSFAMKGNGEIITLEPHYSDKFLLPQYLSA